MPSLLAVPAHSTSNTSRIPRTRSRTTAAIAARPDSETDNDDENSNPPPTRRRASLAGKSAGETIKGKRRVVFATIAAANQETAVPLMPTPPNSQSPPRKKGSKAVAKGLEPGPAVTKPSKLPRARPQSGAAAATSATATTGSSAKPRRAPSRSPIPAGPSHAPHILAARRRASVSPLPPTLTAPPPVAATASTSFDGPTKKPRQPRKKVVRPRPSELLPVPIGSPPSSQNPSGGGGDDSEADELLLLPPEMTRGRGEGKVRPPHHHQSRYSARAGSASASQHSSFLPSMRRRSTSREVVGGSSKPASQESVQSVKSEESNVASGAYFAAADGLEMARATMAAQGMSFSITAPSSDAAFGDADPFGELGDAAAATGDQDQDDALHAADEAEADMGGFDGHDYFEPVDDYRPDGSPAPVAAAEFDDVQSEHEADEDEMALEAGPRFADLEEASSGSEMGGDDDDGDGAKLGEDVLEQAEEDDRVVEEPVASRLGEMEEEVDAAALDAEASEIASSTDEDEAALERSSYELPPHSARQSRPSYPPLSPTRTGEVDDVVPVRMESSSPEPELHSKAQHKTHALSERELEKQPQVEVEEAADVFGTAAAQDTSADNIKPSIAALSGAISPRPFPLHGTPSAPVLPALLRPSSFFPAGTRSPSPAAFGSPNPIPSPAARPTLHFASPRMPRERFAPKEPSPAVRTTGARTPGPTSFASPDVSPAKTWTRGPAFFRSSSFSPPAHAALPKTATLFERHPGGRGARQRARGEPGAVDQSREYQAWAGLDTSSPSQSQEAPSSSSRREQPEDGETSDEEEEDGETSDEEEEDEVILVGEESQALERAKSRSLSPASSASSAATDGRLPASQKEGMLSDPASESDRDLQSPARSISGDICMGSPSPRQSTSAERQQPATPRESAAEGGETDCRMASPSPARSEYSKAQGSPLRARFGDFVEGSKSRIQGLLFGSPQKAPVSQPQQAPAPTDQGRGSRSESAAGDVVAEDEIDESEQPFVDSKLHPQAPVSVADSTFSLSRSMGSFASSNTSRRSRRRSRPSHPTLPVIEISSTDAHAAARAAAILKVYHKYVEQGVEAVDLERLVAAEQAGVALDKSVAANDASRLEEDDEEEEELRTLLLDAEDELREMVPRQPSVLANGILADLDRSRDTASSTNQAPEPAPIVWTSREWRRLEQALVEVGRKRQRASSMASAASISMSMTSEAIAAASVTGEDIDPDEVIEAFLRKWRISKDAFQADWAWDKLVIRVEALKARRAKDARARRASTADSARSGPAIEDRRPARELSVVEETADEPDAFSDAEDSEAEDNSLVKLESSDEADADALTPIEERSFADTSSASDEEDGADDETFFASERRYRRRRSSIEPVHQPTALANPALRHLYDATPAPEKPQLPFSDIVRTAQPSAELEDEIDESGSESVSAGTPEPLPATEEPGRSPSSASRLLSYLGSFVRRSPAVSPSSTRAASRSTSDSRSRPEMQQVQRDGSDSIVPLVFADTSASFPASTSKPLPPISDRKILPIPPSHAASAASTSRVSLDEHSFDTSQAGNTTSASSSFVPLAFRRRRRSSNSGERSLVWDVVNAIEEAESSREEEEARIVDLLQNSSGSLTGAAGTKRRAAAGDLRGGDAKGKGKAVDWRGYVEIDRELERGFLATGLRATDRRVSGEKRATRR